MSSAKAKPPFLEWMLAGVLHYGTCIASATIAMGLMLALIDSHFGTHDLAVLPNMRIVTIGVALFILLPVSRVGLMLVVFLRERDYHFSAIAALVLMIILVSCAVGMHMASVAAK